MRSNSACEHSLGRQYFSNRRSFRSMFDTIYHSAATTRSQLVKWCFEPVWMRRRVFGVLAHTHSFRFGVPKLKPIHLWRDTSLSKTDFSHAPKSNFFVTTRRWVYEWWSTWCGVEARICAGRTRLQHIRYIFICLVFVSECLRVCVCVEESDGSRGCLLHTSATWKWNLIWFKLTNQK